MVKRADGEDEKGRRVRTEEESEREWCIRHKADLTARETGSLSPPFDSLENRGRGRLRTSRCSRHPRTRTGTTSSVRSKSARSASPTTRSGRPAVCSGGRIEDDLHGAVPLCDLDRLGRLF